MNRRQVLAAAASALGTSVLDLHIRQASAAKESKSLIIAFAGYTPANETYEGTGTEAMVKQLRSMGMRAEIYNPYDVTEVGDRILSQPRHPRLRLLGYSFGARAAISLANRVEPAGVPVPLVVLLEAWYPVPITANVPQVIHYMVSGHASEVMPGPGFRGRIENIDLQTALPGLGDVGHLTAPTTAAVQGIVIQTLIRGQPVVTARPH